MTPTEFTQLSTVWSRLFFSFAWSTSCWYWPTPMLFGSIFTSSASGSMSLRPIDTAPRTVTSLSGNSSRATLDAEYTEAPSSLTLYILMLSDSPADLMKASVSRPAVPLPMAMASGWYCFTMSLTRVSASLRRLAGGWGNIASWCSRLPWASRHTTLHPVLKPGSIPITRFGPKGAASSSWRRFIANTLMASSSACSFEIAANSVSMAGFTRRFRASSTASPTSLEQRDVPFTNIFLILCLLSSSSADMLTRSMPSASPRRIASSLWAGQRRSGSLKSK